MGGIAQRFQADRLKFPGMLPREIVVFRAWLALHESEFTRFEFNVRVGLGDDPGPTFPDEIRRQAVLNTQKRIDAVGFKGPLPTIFEVKDRAQLSAVGQLVGYRPLFAQSFPLSPTPLLVLITNRASQDLIAVTRSAGIDLQLVEADFSDLRRRA